MQKATGRATAVGEGRLFVLLVYSFTSEALEMSQGKQLLCAKRRDDILLPQAVTTLHLYIVKGEKGRDRLVCGLVQRQGRRGDMEEGVWERAVGEVQLPG